MAIMSGGLSAGEAVWTVRGDITDLEKNLATGAQKVQSTTGQVTQNLATVGKGMTAMGAAIVAPMALGVNAAAEFGGKMAEVSTLGVQDMDGLTAAVREVGVEYGQNLTDAAGAAYQAISAGVSEADAPLVLAEAAKAATAGVSDLTTSIELGTSVTNAFGGEMTNVSGIYNEAFTAVKLGVTTLDELSASVGKVSPMFASAGLASKEMFASIAALTKGGLATAEAVTGMKGALTAIIKPTSEASQMAESLGMDFNVASLQSKGLAGFLDMVKNATGGNVETMAQLFGSVEGLNAVLALTGTQSEAFTQILGEMENGAGATDAAFQKIKENDPGFAWRQAKAAMQDLTITIGEAVLPALGKLVETIKPIVESIANWMKAHESLTSAIILGAGALGVFMVAVGPILMMLPGLATLLGAVSSLFGAGGIATSAAAAAPAIASVGTAAGTAAGASGIGALTAGLAGIAWPVAAGVAIGVGLVAIGASAWETKKSFDQLEESEAKSAAMGDRYTQHLRDKGIAFNEAAMAAMGLSEKVMYGAEAEKQAADISARAWFEYFAGREETEKEFAQMRSLLLNEHITAEEAAIAVSKGLNEQTIKELMQADQEKTESMLNNLGIREEAEKQTGAAIEQASLDAAQRRNAAFMQSTEELILHEQQAAAQVSSFWDTTFGGIIQAVAGLPVVIGDFMRSLAGYAPLQGALASGGPASAGMPYLVGEEGPELFVPRVSGQVMSAPQTAAALGGGSQTININMGGVSLASDMDVDAVARRLGDKLRQRITGVGGTTDWRRV